MANPKKFGNFVLEFNYCPCKGCDKLLKKVEAIEWVHSIDVDESKRELTVFGPVKPETVIKKIKENGKYAKFLRGEEESPPEINHKEMQIVLQHNRIQTYRDQRKVVSLLPGLIREPVDTLMGRKLHDSAKCNHEFELLRKYNKPFKCNGCKEGGYASAYRCRHCSYELHDVCKDPKPEVTPEFFKGSKFKFSQEPGKICDACGLQIHGHSYGCRADNLDLHPACAKLPLRISNTDFVLSNKVEYKCFCCDPKEHDETGVTGLCYVSKKNEFSCHVHCVPQVMEEAWKRGDLDHNNDGDENDGISKTLKNVDRKPLANVKRSGGKAGSLFVKVVTVVLKTVIGVLFGDPTGLIVSVFTEIGKELLTL